jgi:hypothetical protein
VNSKNKNIRDLFRGINEFKRGYQPRSNLIKDENGDLLADSHLLNVHNVNYVRQIEIHTAEPLVPGPSHLDREIAFAKLKEYKCPSSGQILAEMIQARGETLMSAIHKLVHPFGIRRNCLISGRCLLLYQFTRRVIQLTVIIIVGYHCYQLHTKCYRLPFSQG